MALYECLVLIFYEVATLLAFPFGFILNPDEPERFAGGTVRFEEEEAFVCVRLNPSGEEPSRESLAASAGFHGGRKGSGDWTHPCSTTSLPVNSPKVFLYQIGIMEDAVYLLATKA